MIVALIALAAVMIIGGVASVVQGFPFVRLESGLAMTIAGATTASAGAVLLGLAAVAQRLKGLERRFAEGRERGTQTVPPSLVPPSLAPLPFAPTEAPLQGFPDESLLSADATASGRFAGAPGAVSVRPVLPIFAEATPLRGRETERPLEVYAPPFPEPDAHTEPAPELRPRLDDGIAPEDDLFAGPAPLRPAVSEPPFVAAPPETAAPPPAAAPQKPEAAGAEPAERKRDVVGTYASGGNTYVMFADGSIEADTPRGRFTFHSLDELKAFVEDGGESDARGAA